MEKTSTARPIFVVGAPRTGTTLIGNYVASHPRICNTGEFWGFVLALDHIPKTLRRVYSPYKDIYIKNMLSSTLRTIDEITSQSEYDAFCDATPFNIEIIKELEHIYDDALYILSLRNYRGVIQSLERAYNDGYNWAGSNLLERAFVWKNAYQYAAALPQNRTIAFSYDLCCASPENTIAKLNDDLAKQGIDAGSLDLKQFSYSHATNERYSRLTFAKQNSDGSLRFSSFESYHKEGWYENDDPQLHILVDQTEAMLRTLFPMDYVMF